MVDALPTPTISFTSTCANSAGNIIITEPGMSNYLWIVTGGIITAGGGTSDNTVTVSWGAAGTGSVQVNYTNGNGCTAAIPTDSTIIIHPLPTPTISSNKGCTNSANTYFTESGMSNYLWTVTGGALSGGGGLSDTSVTITWGAVGTGTITVNYTDGNGCTAAIPTDSTIQ